jgi:hypothetical protein
MKIAALSTLDSLIAEQYDRLIEPLRGLPSQPRAAEIDGMNEVRVAPLVVLVGSAKRRSRGRHHGEAYRQPGD